MLTPRKGEKYGGGEEAIRLNIQGLYIQREILSNEREHCRRKEEEGKTQPGGTRKERKNVWFAGGEGQDGCFVLFPRKGERGASFEGVDIHHRERQSASRGKVKMTKGKGGWQLYGRMESLENIGKEVVTRLLCTKKGGHGRVQGETLEISGNVVPALEKLFPEKGSLRRGEDG